MDNQQRRLALKNFLSCSGFRIFMEDVKNFIDTNQNDIDKRLGKPISADELASLNQDLGQKCGMKSILNVLEGYKEELESNSPGKA